MLQLLDDEVLFLVYGVGGIGKSEFIYQLMSEARATPQWRDAVPVHLEVRAGSSGTRALAELLAIAGAPPEPRRGQATEVEHLNEQLAALAQLLDARPHLVFLDDVHHLHPEAVSEALSFLSRRVRRSRIFVASRQEIRIHADAALPVVTTLGPLDPEAAEQMMDALVERLQVARPGVGAVMRASHGSPFHIRRLLARDSGGEDSLERSLQELSGAARRVLLAAALSPHRPSLQVLQSAWGTNDSLDDIVRELERRFLLDVEDDRLIVHDLVREALLRVAGEQELEVARRDCAGLCLGELERSDPPALIHAVDAIHLHLSGQHWLEAWQLVERWHSPLASAGSDHLLLEPLERLRDVLPERRTAIDLLIARSLVRASLIERADGVLGGIGEPTDDADAARYFALSGEIAQRKGDLARAEALFGAAVERAPHEGARFQARLQTAIVAAYRGEGERARQILDTTLGEVASPTAAQVARCRWARTLSWLLDERYELATEEARQAREDLTERGHRDLRNQLAMFETLAGIGREDMTLARDAMRHIDESGLRRRVASLYRAIVMYSDGEAKHAWEELLEAHDYLRAHGDTANAYLAGYYGSAALAELGRLTKARELAARATELARAAGLRGFVARSLAQEAIHAAEAIQTQDAHRFADEALGSEHIGPRSVATAHRAHAHAYAVEGDIARSLEHLAAARKALEGLDVASSPIDLEHAGIELVGGRFDRAVERAESTTTLTRPYDIARAQVVLAAAYVARGRRTDLVLAEGALARAKELAERGELRSVRVGCAIVSAGLARRANRVRAADEVLTDALRQIDPEHGSVYANALRAAIDGGQAARVVPGAVALLAHLGLSEMVDCYLVDRTGRRAATRKDIERERAQRELVVDELEGVIVARRGEIEITGRPLQCSLLSVLVCGRGEAVSAEAIYEKVWGVAEYHPLQHRNTLYVAINRLRKTLREAFPDREIVERTSSGWRLGAVDACVAIAATEGSGDRG